MRNALIIAALTIGVVLSYFLASDTQEQPQRSSAPITQYPGYYIVGATVRGIGSDGRFLYSLDAAQAVQDPNGNNIELSDVTLNFAGTESVGWTLKAATAIISSDGAEVLLGGGVTAESDEKGVTTSLEATSLTLNPESYMAKTDDRVTLRVGRGTLSATGMLAFLNENRIEFKSNVSGRFVP